MSTLNGCKVVANPNLIKAVTTKIYKPWHVKLFDEVSRWNPCNEVSLDYETTYEPSSEVIFTGSTIYAHPTTIQKMVERIASESPFNNYFNINNVA